MTADGTTRDYSGNTARELIRSVAGTTGSRRISPRSGHISPCSCSRHPSCIHWCTQPCSNSSTARRRSSRLDRSIPRERPAVSRTSRVAHRPTDRRSTLRGAFGGRDAAGARDRRRTVRGSGTADRWRTHVGHVPLPFTATARVTHRVSAVVKFASGHVPAFRSAAMNLPRAFVMQSASTATLLSADLA